MVSSSASVASPAHLIVIGTATEEVPELASLLAQLPGSLPAAVLVVHQQAIGASGERLVDRLNR